MDSSLCTTERSSERWQELICSMAWMLAPFTPMTRPISCRGTCWVKWTSSSTGSAGGATICCGWGSKAEGRL